MMRRRFSIYFFLAIILVFCLAACRSKEDSSNQPAEEPVVWFDISNRAYRALVETWTYQDTHPENQASLQELIKLEEEIYQPLKDRAFTEEAYNGLVDGYLLVLAEGEQLLASYDQEDFAEKWDFFQEKRKVFYRDLSNRGILYVPEEFQLRLDYFLASPWEEEYMHRVEEEVRRLIEGVTIEKTDQIYGNGYPIFQGQVEHSVAVSVPSINGKVLLKDQEGQVVAQRLFRIEDWGDGAVAKIEFITPKDFMKAEVVVDEMVIQWPWRTEKH